MRRPPAQRASRAAAPELAARPAPPGAAAQRLLAQRARESGGTGATGATGSGGSGTGGATGATGSGGSGTGGATGATGSGGAATAGAAGAESGGTGATGATGSGGAATAGAGGETSGGAPTAGAGGEGGAGGAGGAAAAMVFDFETDAQGWASTGTGVTVAVATAQAVTGSQSLGITLPALTSVAADADAGTAQTCDGRTISVGNPGGTLLWPGAVLTLHVWVPTAVGSLSIQAFSQTNGWKWNSSNNTGNGTLTAGGWTTWTYTLPSDTPAGLQELGIQAQVCGGGTFAGGIIYLDSITVSGGQGSCAGTATRTYSWETASAVDGWTVNNTPADTAITQSTTQAYTGAGTGSLQVAFTSLSPSDAGSVSRQVMLASPQIYCGQTATFQVFIPTGFGAAGMSVQSFAQVNNYGAGGYWGPYATVTENAWNTITLPVPTAVDTRGVNQIGLQFNLSSTAAAAYTGMAYIDAVTW